MALLNRWRVGERMALGFGSVIALLLVLATVSLINLGRIGDASQVLLGVQAEKLSLAREWRENVLVNAQRSLAIGYSADDTLQQRFSDLVKATTARTSEVQKRYADLDSTDEAKTILGRVADVRKRYLATRDEMLAARGNPEKVARTGAAFIKVMDEYTRTITELVAYEQARSATLGAEVTQAIATTRALCIGVSVVGVVLATLLSVGLSASITRPLAGLQDAARRIASGDLSQTLPANGRSETAQLMGDMARMQAALRALVTQVRDASDSISNASGEVAAGNADLSRRTEQAAGNLQQTASSIEQITGTVRQSAEVASQANQLAGAASGVARQGGEIVSGVVTTMEQINTSSRKISEIIGVIDGIAFQTNILALNAAVEAARAGEQGRGFAVVAGEVRALAHRSAEAARQIKTLISDSVEKVDHGSRLVGEAGRTMTDIVNSVQRVTDLIGEITVATREQSSGLGLVNGSVADLDRVTQQNAALVEQSAAASESLQGQASHLNQLVSRYSV